MQPSCPLAEDLMQMACDRTGLSDLGEPARHVGLFAYIAGVGAERWPLMNERARPAAVDYLVYLRSLRLQLVADRKRYPEIAAQEIKAPIIIIGPPPAPGAPTAQRMEERAPKRLMGLFDAINDIFVAYPYMIVEAASALAKCGSDILNLTFTSRQLLCCYRSESYRRYLLETDYSAAVSFHRDFLQHLQWGAPGRRWAFKGSDHLLWLEELAGCYSDAMLVWTHRDLAQQLGSRDSVQAILEGIAGEEPRGEARKSFGRTAVEHQCATLHKGMQARDRIGEERFLDVSCHDLMASPVPTMQRIYSHFRLEMSARHAANIQSWLDNNSQTKHGVHRHSPEEFGIEGGAVNAQFADYMERFGFGVRPELRA